MCFGLHRKQMGKVQCWNFFRKRTDTLLRGQNDSYVADPSLKYHLLTKLFSLNVNLFTLKPHLCIVHPLAVMTILPLKSLSYLTLDTRHFGLICNSENTLRPCLAPISIIPSISVAYRCDLACHQGLSSGGILDTLPEHYRDVTLASWRLTSRVTRLFAQHF